MCLHRPCVSSLEWITKNKKKKYERKRERERKESEKKKREEEKEEGKKERLFGVSERLIENFRIRSFEFGWCVIFFLEFKIIIITRKRWFISARCRQRKRSYLIWISFCWMRDCMKLAHYIDIIKREKNRTGENKRTRKPKKKRELFFSFSVNCVVVVVVVVEQNRCQQPKTFKIKRKNCERAKL